MSRLQQRLRELSAQSDPRRRAEKESHVLAGDGLEMAARAALEAWQERPRHPDESDVFRLGYRLACHELALVFRAMRKGEPPTKEEFAELRRLVFEDAAGETVTDGSYPTGDELVEEAQADAEYQAQFVKEQSGESDDDRGIWNHGSGGDQTGH